MITIRERLDEFEKFIAEEIKSADCGDCVTELKHFFVAQLEDVYREISDMIEGKHDKPKEEIIEYDSNIAPRD